MLSSILNKQPRSYAPTRKRTKMKIVDYEYISADWNFQKVEFKNLNLIVGDSGSGKTRLLNSIFNLGSSVAQGKISGISEKKITLEINQIKYYWDVTTAIVDEHIAVKNEQLLRNGELILSRLDDEFVFLDKTLPKLERNKLSISLLKEEEVIKPLFDGFSKILRRRFFSDDTEKNAGNYLANEQFLSRIRESKDLYELYKADLPLNLRLFILSESFPDLYEKIVDLFKESFGFIEAVEIKNSNELTNFEMVGSGPVFCIKERNVEKFIRLDEMSSGMQKTLLIITDLYALPSGTIYFIDEYENSLGIGAINALPNALLAEEFDIQLFVTSHHPYIISKFPVENWYVAHRKGSNVRFAYGSQLVERYNLSKQDKYFQLLNDPYYSEGIE